MTVALFDPLEKARIGGLSKISEGLYSFTAICRGNSDTTGVALELSYNSSFTALVPGTYTTGAANSGNNYQGLAEVSFKATPNQVIYWRIKLEGVGGPITSTVNGFSGSFQTPPSKEHTRKWKAACIGCTAGWPTTNNDSQLYRTSMRKNIDNFSKDFLIAFGDHLYPESGNSGVDLIVGPEGTLGNWYIMDGSTPVMDLTVGKMRNDWYSQLAYTGTAFFSFSELFSKKIVYPLKDDHDYFSVRRKPYPAGGTTQRNAIEVGDKVYEEYIGGLNKPLINAHSTYNPAESENPILYFSFEYFPVEFIVLDVRSYQNIDDVDDSSKTLSVILGSQQRDWLYNKIQTSTAPILAIVSSLMLDSNHGYRETAATGDNLKDASYAVEELRQLLQNNRRLSSTVVLAGDAHNGSVAIYRGASRSNKPLWEFSGSHGVRGSGGHDYPNGWSDKLMGKDFPNLIGFGGYPIVARSGKDFHTNMITMENGRDSRGHYLKIALVETYPYASDQKLVNSKPIFSKKIYGKQF